MSPMSVLQSLCLAFASLGFSLTHTLSLSHFVRFLAALSKYFQDSMPSVTAFRSLPRGRISEPVTVSPLGGAAVRRTSAVDKVCKSRYDRKFWSIMSQNSVCNFVVKAAVLDFLVACDALHRLQASWGCTPSFCRRCPLMENCCSGWQSNDRKNWWWRPGKRKLWSAFSKRTAPGSGITYSLGMQLVARKSKFSHPTWRVILRYGFLYLVWICKNKRKFQLISVTYSECDHLSWWYTRMYEYENKYNKSLMKIRKFKTIN